MSEIKIAQAAIDLITMEEIGAEYPGDHRYYDKDLIHPTWPGGDSGITVGVGYDLGQMSKENIQQDWQGKVNGNYLITMMGCSGLTGQRAKIALNNTVKQITIPYEVAMQVFDQSDLPRSYKQAARVYPGLENLNPETIGAIVSLVFNRGAALQGHNREGMAALVPLVAKADYTGIANTIEAMKTLWPETSGLYKRRINEANLIRNSISGTASTGPDVTIEV